MTITTAEIAAIRAEIARLALPDTCIITTPTRTTDGAGGWTTTYTSPTGGTVACRVSPISVTDRETIIAGGATYMHMYYLAVPYDAPITAKCRITYASNDYEIVHFTNGRSLNFAQQCVIGRNEK